MRADRPRGAELCAHDDGWLTEDQAEAHTHGICFKTGPPALVGVELEWLVHDGSDPALPVSHDQLAAVRASAGAGGPLPGGGALTIEPGGQLEISSAAAPGLTACISAAQADLAALRGAATGAGLYLLGRGLDAIRPPRRILEQPRYAAMEEFFDRSGPWGRVMMCSTASVQVCLDAGEEGDGTSGYAWRWRLLHAIGPVILAMFANSPVHHGRPTGWKSTRQAVWARLDPTRTRSPARAQCASTRDPRSVWADYALDANVLCVRRPGPGGWAAPPGLTFRQWLRGGGDRPPTLADLSYHLTTLFPPVRPRGHLEFRALDAQGGDGWVVAAAVVTALVQDPVAAQEAMAAATRLWHAHRHPWAAAARHGPADPDVRVASVRCLAAAESALGRLAVPPPVRRAVSAFAERYTDRGRCPADDWLDGRGPPAPLTMLEGHP
jgi:ergothioneine biosynthesis glutamate--cysteine ligase EgtA